MNDEMLEIRGISRNELITYLMQIGATTKNNHLFLGENWTCQISEEDHFHMFQSWIPKVSLIFSSEDPVTLKKVVMNFRKKTFRAGG